MDMPQVLAVLRPGEDWGPCAQSESTYADLARTWRSPESACPTEAEMLACWAALEAGRAAAVVRAARTQAVGVLTGRREPDLQSLALLVRMLAQDFYTRLNDLRELHGLPRVLEPEIMAGLIAGLGG